MARKSGPKQLKREPAPGFWPISRKTNAWIARTRAGAHTRNKSLPLVIVIREILGYAKTAREAIRIISSGKVKVDGTVRRDYRFPVGLMDVLQIQGASNLYRILPKHNAGLVPSPIQQKESEFKLCKIVGKKTISGGKSQISFHDGRSMIIHVGAQRARETEEYVVGGAVQLALRDRTIIAQIPFEKGAFGLVIDGQNLGLLGKIEAITSGTHARQRTVRIETPSGTFETPAAYVIPIGTEAALIEVGK